MLKAAARAVKNYAKGYSDTQAKVHEATSTDPWGPSTTQMHEIAQLTYNQGDFVEIIEIIDKRLNDKGKDWIRVFKSLTVLDYLLHHGTENITIYFKDNLNSIKSLRDFEYVDEDGKDQGSNVRQKAKDITNLLQDEARLRTERNKSRARANPSAHNRITNGTTANGYPNEKSASSSRKAVKPSLPQEQTPEPTNNVDDEELRRAIDLSMQEQQEYPEDIDLLVALEASLLRRSPLQRARDDNDRPGGPSPPPYTEEYDDRDLRRAIELSQQQPEDVDLRRAIELSLLANEGREGDLPRPRPPSYAAHYTRGMHDALSTTGSENHVSVEEEPLMDAPNPATNGASEHGDSVERDDESAEDSSVQRLEIGPVDDSRSPEVSPPIPPIDPSPRSPPLQLAAVEVSQQTSVSPEIPFSLPERRSPINEVDPVIPASDGNSSGEDSSLENRLRKSDSSSSGSRSVTPDLVLGPSPSPQPALVPLTTSTAATNLLLPQLSPPPPLEQTAERTAGDQAMPSADNTPSATESENNVSAESSEGPPSWQTEAYIDSLLASWERRRPLLSMVMLPDADRRGLSAAQVRQRLEDIEAQISVLLIHIIGSKEARRAAQRLESERAQSFMDAVQDALDRGTLPDSSSRSKARYLMQKVSEAREQLPSSLFIEGVNDHDEHPTFGGGFGDVYQASYQGKTVALKRIRTFTADSTTHRNRLQFYKEALVWQGLRHRFILPLLGIDRSTFAPSFCMVSPWMKHGTVLKYLRDHGREQVNRLLLETAQGLDYLHSMNIVHGDLRGANILITDDGSACLSDFGLATTIADADSTAGVTSSSNRAGSVRWFAPELIEPTDFGCTKFIRTKASDVYAYACVCLELYTGNPPFSHLPDVAAMLRVIRGERPEQPPSIPVAVWQLVTSAWVEDSRVRPTIHDIAVALESIP